MQYNLANLISLPFEDINVGDIILYLQEDEQSYNTAKRVVIDIIEERIYYYFPNDTNSQIHYIAKDKIECGQIAVINTEKYPEYFL